MIAGIGGINYVLGYKHYYEEGFAGGAGFLGIAVALVGRNHPLGVVLAALFFATLSQGGLAIHAFVPEADGGRAPGRGDPRRGDVGARSAARPAQRAQAERRVNPLSFLARCCASRFRICSRRAGAWLRSARASSASTLEGFMLGGAFGAVLGTNYSGSPWIGVLCRNAGRTVFALIHAVATIRYRADQVVVGIAINLLAIGVTRFFLKLFFASSSNSPRVAGFGGNIEARRV